MRISYKAHFIKKSTYMTTVKLMKMKPASTKNTVPLKISRVAEYIELKMMSPNTTLKVWMRLMLENNVPVIQIITRWNFLKGYDKVIMHMFHRHFHPFYSRIRPSKVYGHLI